MPFPKQDPADNQEHWFALKVFYNRVAYLAQYLEQNGVETYIPMRYTESVGSNGKRKIERQPAVSSLLFVRQTERYVLELQKNMKARYPLMAYFDRELKRPAVIPDAEMRIFIQVTSAQVPELEYYNEGSAKYRMGDKVRVTGGPFEGAEGYIKRIKGNKRLVVSIEGIISVATTYIPQCFIEKIG